MLPARSNPQPTSVNQPASRSQSLSKNILQSIFEFLPSNFWLRVVGLLSKQQREMIETLMTLSPHSDLRLTVPAECLLIPLIVNHLLTSFPEQATLVIKPIESSEQYLCWNTLWHNLLWRRTESPSFEICCPKFALVYLGDFSIFMNDLYSFQLPPSFLPYVSSLKRIRSVKF